MTSLHLALALGTSVGALLLTPQGDDSYTGTWKLNVAKSKFTGRRDKVAAAGANAWTFSYGTSSWTVKTDGSDTPTPFGNTVALQAESPTTWRFSWKAPNGQALATETWTLSADGKSMSRVSSGTRESGERFSDTTQMKRVAGTQGFAGTWETAVVKISAPTDFTARATATGLDFKVPAENFSFTCSYDGKPNATHGPRVPAGQTVACTKRGKSVQFIVKIGDKTFTTIDWSISADGKQLTSTAHDTGVPEPYVGVYDRVAK